MQYESTFKSGFPKFIEIDSDDGQFGYILLELIENGNELPQSHNDKITMLNDFMLTGNIIVDPENISQQERMSEPQLMKPNFQFW